MDEKQFYPIWVGMKMMHHTLYGWVYKKMMNNLTMNLDDDD